MNRRKQILEGISKEMRGIEVAPYFAPLTSKRDGYDCRALDVFDTAELVARATDDPNIPKEKIPLIEAVDLVGSATEIANLIPASEHGTLDYIVSSHNFEHLPNPIRFLQGCCTVLKPGGILSMAVPDSRACFDFFRPHTVLADWLESFKDGRTKPTPKQVFAQIANVALLQKKDTSAYAFSLNDPVASIAITGDLPSAYRAWSAACEGDQYQDAHCSVFTPASFELLITECRQLELVLMETVDISSTGGCEFIVRLVNRPTVQAMPAAEFAEHRGRLLHSIWNERVQSSAWGQTVFKPRRKSRSMAFRLQSAIAKARTDPARWSRSLVRRTVGLL
jgi:SAM-dependent methyltransferase